jgi:hypothetical protein
MVDESNVRGLQEARPPVSRRAPYLSVNHLCEEGGRLERHGVNRASLSGHAWPPGRFTFREAVGGDRRGARYAQTGAVVISPPHCVRREGVEPSRH